MFTMKKLIVLLMVLVMSIGAMAAFAEDEDMVTYLEEHPEAAGYVSTWIAEDGVSTVLELSTVTD